MLGHDFFYNESIKKYIIAFSHLLDNIHINRFDDNGAIVKDIVVPVSYAQKSKLFQILQRKDNIKDKQVSTYLPRIFFILNSLKPDSSRQRNVTNLIDGYDAIDGYVDYTNAAIAYNFSFDVSIVTKYLSDLYQALEQILAMFTPDYQNLNVNLIPQIGLTANIKTILEGVELDISSEFDSESYRTCQADLSFTLEGYLFKPIIQSKIINHVIIDINDTNNTEATWQQLTADTSIPR